MSMTKKKSGVGRMVEPYSWMTGGDVERKLEVMTEIVEKIEAQPETSLTYSPKYYSGVQWRFVVDVLNSHGFWKMPHDPGRRTKFVNPEHKDAEKHSDVVVECKCGAKILHQHKRHVDQEVFNDHSEDCLIEWRKRSVAQLWENRREIVHNSGVHMISSAKLMSRLGVSGRRPVYSINKELGIDYQELKEKGARKRWITWTWLRDMGFKNTEIGDAFGVAPNTVSGAEKRAIDSEAVTLAWREDNDSAQKPDWIRTNWSER